MSKEFILPLVRHALTAAGAALVSKGIVTDGQWTEAVGALTTLFSVGWYILDKVKSNKAKAAKAAGTVGLVALIAAFSTGCETPKQAAYKTLGVVGMTVDKAMHGAADAVWAGKLDSADYNRIAVIHAKYLVAYNTACDMASHDYGKFAPEDLLRLQKELLDTINLLLQKEK